MPPTDDRLSLQTFWDTIEQRLAGYSAEELRTIVRKLAQATSATERQAFLDILPGTAQTSVVTPHHSALEALLADITVLADQLQEATEAAEGWDEYDDEDSLGPYAVFVDPLTALFNRAAVAFESGDRTLARTAYHALFETLDLEDDYGRGVQAEDLREVDMRAARARYLRAIYDTESPVHRPAVLFDEMLQGRAWLSGPRPMLDDLIQIAPQPLPDRQQFSLDWQALLQAQSGSDADAWLREVVRLSQGTPGLAALARAEGVQRPRAYLDWCAALAAEGNDAAVLTAAQEALQALPETLPIRAAVADYLCAAALHQHDTVTLRAGRWEAFVAKPTLARLLDVWDAAADRTARTVQMQQAAQHMQYALAHPPSQTIPIGEDALEHPVWPDKFVLAHADLLAGDWPAAHQLAAPEQVLGWSSSHNPQGLVVACLLVQMSDTSPDKLPPNLTQLWHWELQNSTGFVSWHSTDAGEASLLMRLHRAYVDYLPAASLAPDQQAALLAWCLDVAQRRINAIVGNKHRGSYDKAALLLAACAELLQLLGKTHEATALLDDVRQRFPRHRAFQSEVQTAVRRMGEALSG